MVTARLTQRGKARRHALRRALLAALGAVGSSWIVYLLLGNLAAMRYLEAQAEGVRLSLSIGWARTWVPGTWSLGRVRLERAGAWSVSAEHARLDLHLGDWIRGRAHVTELVLEGATLEVILPRAGGSRAADVGSLDATAASIVASERPRWGPEGDVRRIVFDHIAADGGRVRVGRYELAGKLAYRTRGPTDVGSGEVQMTGKLDFAGARLRVAGKPTATVSGRASVELSTLKRAPDASRTAARRATWRLATTGRLNAVGASLPSAAIGLTLDGASYRGNFEAVGDHLGRGALVLQAPRAALDWGANGRSELIGNVELRIDFEGGRPDQGHARLNAERWNLWDEVGRPWAKVAGLSATLDWRENSAGPFPATLEATGESLELNALNARVTGRAAARFEVPRMISGGRLHGGTGEVHVRHAEMVPDAAPSTAYGLGMDLRIERFDFDLARGLEFSGDLAVHGENARMLFDLAQANQNVRWTLSMLEGQPFELSSGVMRRMDAVALAQLKLTCAGLEARGAFYAWNNVASGALFVDGPMRVGILLNRKGPKSAAELEVVAPVTPRWLDPRVEALAERWRARSGAPMR